MLAVLAFTDDNNELDDALAALLVVETMTMSSIRFSTSSSGLDASVSVGVSTKVSVGRLFSTMFTMTVW